MLTVVADINVLLLEVVDADVQVLASPAVLEDVAFALERNSNEPSSPVKLGASLASLAPIHQKRPPILIIANTQTKALDITNKTAILFCMSPTCVDAQYLYFGTRNKHTSASTLQEIRVRDYGVIRLLMLLFGGVVTIRQHTSPLSTSLTCKERQAQLLLCPANCGCKISLPRGKIQGCQGLWTQKWEC